MCMRDDKVQAKLRVTLNLIHALSKALSVSATLESDLADTAAFNCSELIHGSQGMPRNSKLNE